MNRQRGFHGREGQTCKRKDPVTSFKSDPIWRRTKRNFYGRKRKKEWAPIDEGGNLSRDIRR